MKKRLQDILFTFIVILSIPVSYLAYGLRGWATLAWAFFLPLYVLRILIWSFWLWLRPWLSAKSTPKTWITLVFSTWISLSILIWILAQNILLKVEEISFPTWVQMLGFIFTTGGIILALWAQWLLGLETTILVTRIFDQENKVQQKVITTGPYALFPHPIFLGEWLIIFGCFLLTSQISLVVLLLVAFFSDIFAARGEEKDLRTHFGKEYESYRSKFPV